MKATLTLDTHFGPGLIDPRIYSGFLEHLGRSIYEGVYDPDNALSDSEGFRTDVLAALKKMRMPMVRYPGGNFVSCYDWRDGVGPRSKRPVRPDYAWQTAEPNTFGTDEFVRWCKKLGTAPMMAVNLGTLGAREAADLVEYCNLPTGTHWADQRAAHGHREPHGIKTWCLGNEMDGPWQAGHVPAEEYALRAQQAGKLMKGMDRSIELVLAGSSHRGMATYMQWDRTILEYCWNDVEYISAHRYSGNHTNDSAAFLTEGVEIDRILADYAGLLDYVRGLKRSDKRVYLSFDEWNVWYRTGVAPEKPWTRAPHLLEEPYNLEDALVCAQYLMSFIRRADVVKVACLAQLVNVIGPVMTRKDGILIQSIYHPFVLMSSHMRGRSLTPVIDGPTHKAGGHGEVPSLDSAVSFDATTGEAMIALLNRRVKDSLEVSIAFNDRKVSKVLSVDVLHHKDVKATNTWERPSTVKLSAGQATIAGGTAKLRLPAPSLAVVRVATRGR